MSAQEPQIPTSFPPFITAGASFKLDRQFDDYPASQWTYSLILAGAAATLTKDATADANGQLWHLVLTPADTQSLNPSGGVSVWYTYRERVTAQDGSGEVWFPTPEGKIAVEANLALANAGDAVSFEERTLAAIRAVLEGRITDDIENYSIAGRSVTKIPMRELEQLRGRYEYLVWKQHHPGSMTQPVDVSFPTTMAGPVPYTRRWTG